MFNWVVNRLVDMLIVIVLATLLLWFGASRYPEMVPSAFYHYWGIAAPAVDVASEPVSAVSQVQAQ